MVFFFWLKGKSYITNKRKQRSQDDDGGWTSNWTKRIRWALGKGLIWFWAKITRLAWALVLAKDEVEANHLRLVNGTYYDLFGPWEEDSLGQKPKPTSTALALASAEPPNLMRWACQMHIQPIWLKRWPNMTQNSGEVLSQSFLYKYVIITPY